MLWVGVTNPLRIQREQKGRGRVNLLLLRELGLPSSVLRHLSFRFLNLWNLGLKHIAPQPPKRPPNWPQMDSYTIDWPPWDSYWVIPLAFMVLQFADGVSLDFSIIIWANSLPHSYIHVYIYIRIYVYIFIYTCVRMYVYVYICSLYYVCVCLPLVLFLFSLWTLIRSLMVGKWKMKAHLKLKALSFSLKLPSLLLWDYFPLGNRTDMFSPLSLAHLRLLSWHLSFWNPIFFLSFFPLRRCSNPNWLP